MSDASTLPYALAGDAGAISVGLRLPPPFGALG